MGEMVLAGFVVQVFASLEFQNVPLGGSNLALSPSYGLHTP